MTDSTAPTVDVFTAGCPLCDGAVETVRALVGDAAEVRVLDTHDADVARRARELGLAAVPAVVVGGEPAGCCLGAGPNEDDLVRALHEAGIETARRAADDDAPAARPGCC